MKNKISFFLIATSIMFINTAFSQSGDILTTPVGVGTSYPYGDLHVHGTTWQEMTQGPSTRDGVSPETGCYKALFHLTNPDTGPQWCEGFDITLMGIYTAIQQHSSGSMKIFTKYNMGMTLDSMGRIGIGTDPVANKRLVVNGNAGFAGNINCTHDITAGHSVNTVNLTASGTLSVAGNATIGEGFYCSWDGHVKTKEIVVTLEGWSDYVFDSSYKLMPLGELERYVNTNRHLPNIPSATEVESNGVNIGEMDALLLEKIEELTLYIIDLQKQIDELKKEGRTFT